MDRFDFYFRQQVSESEVDDAFEAAEQADRNMMVDLGFVGMLIPDSPGVLQHSSGDLTVDVTGPASGYDQQGKRIAWPTTIRLSCEEDHNGAATEVVGAANSRYLSIVARFLRVDSDSRTDGNGMPVSYSQAEGYELLVFAGSEALSPTRPSLPTDGLLLADILLVFGQTQILTADILVDRRMEVLVTPALAADYVDHVSGAGDRHTAAQIDASILATWADGTTNPAATVQVMLAKFITDLKATTNPAGAKKIGAVAQSGAQYSLAGGTLESQLTTLLAAANANYAAFGNASGVNASGRSAWLDGETNPSATVQAALAKIITDLTNPTADHTGSARISGESLTHFAGSTIQAMLEAAEAAVPWKNTANTFTAAQIFDNITASGVTRYKLAARARTTLDLPAPIGDDADWSRASDAGRVRIASGAKVLYFPIYPPHNSVINRIKVFIDPIDGHGGAEPGTGPKIRLFSRDQSGVSAGIFAEVTDGLKSSSYDAEHYIDSGAFTHTVDRNTKRYFVQVTSETGSGAVDCDIDHILVSLQVSEQDDAAG